MNKIRLMVALWLVIFCGCRTSNPRVSPSAQGGKLSVHIAIPDYLLKAELGSARIFVDAAFVGNYAEGLVLQLPPGMHTIAVRIGRADEVRRQNDGTTTVRNFRLAGEETIMVFSGESVQNVSFDLANLKKTELDLDDPH